MPILQDFAKWLLDFVLYPLKWIFQQLSAWLVDLINQIELPSWFTSLGDFWSGMPSNVLYLLSWFVVGYGIAITLSAYLIRFLIRRIPIIG